MVGECAGLAGGINQRLSTESGLTESSGLGRPRISGSAQEFDGTRILGRFPEDDEFGLEGGHPLRLQQEVAEISIAASSTE